MPESISLRARYVLIRWNESMGYCTEDEADALGRIELSVKASKVIFKGHRYFLEDRLEGTFKELL